MIPKNSIWILILLLISPAPGLLAQTPTCDGLESTQKDIAVSLLSSQRPYDCCDGTVLECFSENPVCPLVVRLANDICRRAKAGQNEADVQQALSRRAESAARTPMAIDISDSTGAGDPQAIMEIVEYICPRCPFCSIATPHLYDSVTTGALKGKAKLFIRPYIIRSHEGATAGAMAMMAAQRMGKFWDMSLHMFRNFNDFDPAKLPEWAALNGMDADLFRELMDDAGLRQKLIESQKEGIRNGVEGTPTLFINGKRYTGGLALEVVEDFVEGELERLVEQHVTSLGDAKNSQEDSSTH